MLKFAVLLALSLAASALIIPATDSRIYHTEHNWYADPSGYLETANPGAYIKISFNGSSIGIILDKSLLSQPFCTLAWSIDDGPEQNIVLPIGSDYIQLASGLITNRTIPRHSLFIFVKNSEFNDRWNNPDQRVKLMNIVIDENATLFTPQLASKRLLAYWDSIGEGFYTIGNTTLLTSNDAHVTWAFALALALDAELSLVAWSGQGYTVGGSGNIPPLWSSKGRANDSTWKWISSQHPRTFETCPDYIINGHGTNDYVKGSYADLVTNYAIGWLTDMRKTCPQSRIFLTVPFGQFFEKAIRFAFLAYRNRSHDKLTALIALGKDASAGLKLQGPSFTSVDGVHPYAWRSSQLGSMLAVKIANILNQSTTNTTLVM